MTKVLPFTEHSLARAIRGVQRAGLFVVGVKSDGTLIVSERPIDTALLSPSLTEEGVPSKWEDKLGKGRKQNHPKRRFGDRLSMGVAQPSDMETPVALTSLKPGKRRKGGWGTVLEISDPEVVQSYRAAGFQIYEDGEWEAEVRASLMGKRETEALEAYARAKGTIGDVKGAGYNATKRLAARGYVEIVQKRPEGKEPIYGITPAGEAAWKTIKQIRT